MWDGCGLKKPCVRFAYPMTSYEELDSRCGQGIVGAKYMKINRSGKTDCPNENGHERNH